MQIHERIKYERIKAGLTEEELADKIGVKRSTYQYWETKTPNIDKIKQVANALGLADDYFFVTNDEKNNNESGGSDLIGTTPTGQVVYVHAKDLTASYERIIEEKEARRQEAKERAERAEKEKERLYDFIEKYLVKIDSNSENTKIAVSEIRKETIAEHGVMMDSFDLLLKQPIGTTAAKSGNVELAAHQQVQQEKNRKKKIHK